MSKTRDCILYITAGRSVSPEWVTLSSPSARRIHGLIIDELKKYTKQVSLIDDFWLGVRAQYPDCNQSNDKGYHFGYSGSANDPQVNLDRSGKLIERLTALVSKICAISYVIDYPWTEIYVQAKPPT
jgi:hypothetical protein